MGILPVKATPTWAGLRVGTGPTEPVVPWIRALDHSRVEIDGRRVRYEFRASRERGLAAAFRRRAIRSTLRTEGVVRWSDPDAHRPRTDAAERVFILALAVSSTALIAWFMLSRILLHGVRSISEGVPLGLAAVLWAMFLVILSLIPLGMFGLVRLILADQRERLLSVELSRTRMILRRRDRTHTVDAADLASLSQAMSGPVLTTHAGDRVSLRGVPRAMRDTWLALNAPALLTSERHAERRSLRRTAIVVLIALIGLVGLAWLVEPPHSGYNPLQVLAVTPIFPAILWWISSQDPHAHPRRISRRPPVRAAPGELTQHPVSNTSTNAS
jgi:hypothetical protein